jgi:hypothetical protein
MLVHSVHTSQGTNLDTFFHYFADSCRRISKVQYHDFAAALKEVQTSFSITSRSENTSEISIRIILK